MDIGTALLGNEDTLPPIITQAVDPPPQEYGATGGPSARGWQSMMRGGACTSCAQNSWRQAGSQDMSSPVFNPGRGLRVAELLQAIPMVKADPVDAVSKTVSEPNDVLRVRVQRQGAADPPIANLFYDAKNANPTPLTDQLSDIDDNSTFRLGRIGIRTAALRIDSAANRSATSPVAWQVRAAAAAILRALDTTMARGTGTVASLDFKGLFGLASGLNRLVTNPGTDSIEYDARKALAMVNPTGRGAGQGACCLMGGTNVLRALMATTSGQRGASGWRHDARTGLIVYHYMGVPYYRVDADESVAGSTAIYAANLGPAGLCLVHAYGSAETYGLAIDELPIDPTNGTRSLLVHGAFALVAWEPEAIYAIKNTPVATM